MAKNTKDTRSNEEKLREARREAEKRDNPLFSIDKETVEKLNASIEKLAKASEKDFVQAEAKVDERDTMAAVYRQVVAYWQFMEANVNHPYHVLMQKFVELKKRLDAPSREFAGTTGITKVPPNAELRGALEVLETRLDQMKETVAEVISGSYGFKWVDVLEHHNAEETLWAEYKAAQDK